MSDDECIGHVIRASSIENEGIELDRKGDNVGAIDKYQQSVETLSAAIRLCGDDHANDQPKLEQHRKELSERIAYLKRSPGTGDRIPVEDQIKAVQLGMQAAGSATEAVSTAGGVKTLAACAALGAGAGFLVLGGTVGLTLSVVGGGAAAAYAATRKDGVGDAARKAGEAGIAVAGKAKELNDKHHVTEKVVDTSKQAYTKAKEADSKYGISTKMCQGVGKVVAKASEIEHKHQVTDKVAGGLATGLGKLSSALGSGSSEQGASGTAPGQAASTAHGR